MGNFLKEYFNLTNFEQKGVIALIFLILIVFLIPRFYHIFKSPQSYSSSEFEQWVATFKTVTEDTALAFEEESNLHIETTDKSENKAPEILFRFNPNTVSKSELIQLGISENTVETFLKFRASGGKFYKKEDFKKVYGITEATYSRLENYIHIPEEIKPKNDVKSEKIFEEKTPSITLDLNTADSSDFVKLKGIGPVFASRIVKFREKLGGFTDKNQLLEVYGFTDTLFQNIDSFLIIDSKQIKPININTADFKTLISHPYIDYNTTDNILKYRTQNGDFSSVEDLNLLYSLDKETIEKIKPYLTVNE